LNTGLYDIFPGFVTVRQIIIYLFEDSKNK
jgi:hypothetical protein